MRNLIKKNLLLTVIIALLIVGAGLVLSRNFKNAAQTKTPTFSDQKKTVATLEIVVDNKTKHYDLKTGVGKTSLEVTQTATGNVTMTGSGTDAFVTGINGRTAETAKKEFWKLVINGKDSVVGAGTYVVKENDALVWKIDTY